MSVRKKISTPCLKLQRKCWTWSFLEFCVSLKCGMRPHPAEESSLGQGNMTAGISTGIGRAGSILKARGAGPQQLAGFHMEKESITGGELMPI